MPQEIERKFLVRGDFKAYAYQSFRIVQGYLSSVPERTVRIRVKGEQGYLTVKGKSDVHGVTRYEWEKEIAREDAEELLKLCEPGVVDKIRYLVKVGGHIFEVDEFLGENKGLLLAEVELKQEDELFEKPEYRIRRKNEINTDSNRSVTLLSQSEFQTMEQPNFSNC